MLFLLAVTVRILVALLTRTSFQPDEYFQALEPAHDLVFGYGHLTWEWLTPNPIRSILYPLLNVPVFWILKAAGLDSVNCLLIAGPRLVHGTLAALTDLFSYKLARRELGPSYANVALFLSLTSPFNALALSRSLSNSLETSLSTVAYVYYPWSETNRLLKYVFISRLRVVLALAALACLVRPTNAVIWIYLFGQLFANQPNIRLHLTVNAIVTGIVALSIQILADSIYYGRLVITPLNFLRANASSVSLFYGQNNATFYIFQALPVLCSTALPFALHGIYKSLRNTDSTNSALTQMTRATAWTMAVYSLAGHKEWRFIHPLLPLLHTLAAKSIVDLSTSSSPPSKSSKARSRFPVKRAYLALLALGIPASLYVVLIHNSAPISAVAYLHNLPASANATSVVGVLMPCHSLPGQAYLHRSDFADLRVMWSLGCEPPLGLNPEAAESYMDQTTVFFDNPRQYLVDRFPTGVNASFPPSPKPFTPPTSAGDLSQDWRHEWPRYLVLYGALLHHEDVRVLLHQKGYREIWSSGEHWWQGSIGPDEERMGGIRVWRWES
ncbi:glycosyltransferase family 22 protein [Schizophyllum commune H4-8]|uniref:Mannosyltransferase n=1 Tax=Schizophyllum commune (strain H4-8 / FGSC 9210) TaxID=578458 RepID=D8PT04_SCHCM|nr:glycosyltransferase family 22 protein [Schizophyllum commune H4-8]KAI5899481.1 glycosyltransferase family 22 protein [Schizophyllum commune H4-8]